MPESEVKNQTQMVQDNGKQLKYLDFVRVAAIYVLVCFSSVYEYAKENSGPLKSGVETVEGAVRTVIGPVYEKFHDVPFELVKFIDHKVDHSLGELDRHVPSILKQASSQARAVAYEVERAGVVDATKNMAKSVYAKYEPTAWELYCKYEPVAEQYAVSIWRSLNQVPLFSQAAQIAAPTAVYWCQKYNQAICYTADRGYPAAGCFPLIPVDKIAKVFDEGLHEASVSTNGEAAQ